MNQFLVFSAVLYKVTMGKHVMLSYQWNKQDLAEQVYQGLRSHGINAWMDVHGGVKGNVNDR